MRLLALQSFLLFAAQSGAAQAQTLSGGDLGPEISPWRIVAALVLCLALAAAAAFALRRRFGVGGGLVLFTPGPRRMQLIETIRPNPTVAICLIRCDQTEYLISVGPHGGSLVERIEAPKNAGETP